jgi:sulfite dehydrogenase (quinone) subunit SoeB
MSTDGQVGDPGREVFKLVAERGEYDLMPEMGCKPVNKYLLPRPRREATPPSIPFTDKTPTGNDGVRTPTFSAWANTILTR